MAELGQLMKSDGVTGKRSTILGDECVVRTGTSIYTNVQIANDVSFGHNVLVREGVTIGEHTKIGTNVVVDGKCSVRRSVINSDWCLHLHLLDR